MTKRFIMEVKKARLTVPTYKKETGFYRELSVQKPPSDNKPHDEPHNPSNDRLPWDYTLQQYNLQRNQYARQQMDENIRMQNAPDRFCSCCGQRCSVGFPCPSCSDCYNCLDDN